MSDVKLVMFDMDGTLIMGRGIFVIAEKKGFIDELWRYIKDPYLEYYEKSIEIAKLSKGFKKNEYLEIFHKVPLQINAIEVLSELKKKNIKTAIATDSYQILAEDLKQRLGIDYAFANNLVTNDDVITGELKIHNKDLTEDICGNKIYSICKGCVLEQLCKDLNITLNQAIAIGDGIVDIGMIKKAGIGIAFNATDEVKKYADVVSNDLKIILEYI
jgi:phosphoserine phosphatase